MSLDENRVPRKRGKVPILGMQRQKTGGGRYANLKGPRLGAAKQRPPTRYAGPKKPAGGLDALLEDYGRRWSFYSLHVVAGFPVLVAGKAVGLARDRAYALKQELDQEHPDLAFVRALVGAMIEGRVPRGRECRRSPSADAAFAAAESILNRFSMGDIGIHEHRVLLNECRDYRNNRDG